MLDEDSEGKDVKINLKAMDQHLREGQLDHEVGVSLVSPLSLTLRLNLGTRFLFSGGELSQPWLSLCLLLHDHHGIM
jgi:hypothetical protein